MKTMKDHTWLATFSVFTLIVGLLFTYGNSTRADVAPVPIQVFVTSTTTPAAPIVIREGAGAPPVITVNVSIATSSLGAAESAERTASEGATARTYYVTNNTTYTTESANPVAPALESDTVTLSIEGVLAATTTAISEGETVLELLTRLDSRDDSIALSTQDYGDMGILVTALGGHANGTDGKYWQYTVDGVVPLVGADQYTLTDGETLVWEFKGF